MHSTDRLAELVRTKRQILVQLRDVGQRQVDLVAGGDIASLLTLLAAKQKLIAGLQTLERELTTYYAENPEKRSWPSQRARADCAREASECNQLLEQIVQMEKLGAEKMTDRRNEVAEQLQQVHAAAHVRSAYETHRRGAAS